MLSLLKATGGPGSIPFFILAMAIGLFAIYLWPKRRRLAAIWIGTVVGAYLVLGLPVVAHGIADRLPPVPATTSVQTPITTLIILDGDNRRGRVRAAQTIMTSGQPERVWVLGGRWVEEALTEAGVASETFKWDSTAANTFEQMRQVARLSGQSEPGSVAVIVSRLQAPRAAALASALAIPVLIVPAPVDVEPPTVGIKRFIPTYIALRISRDALYEHAALYWYTRKGWIGTSGAKSIER